MNLFCRKSRYFAFLASTSFAASLLRGASISGFAGQQQLEADPYVYGAEPAPQVDRGFLDLFRLGASIQLPRGVSGVATGDLDGDGDPDIVAVGSVESGPFAWIILNEGGALFAPPIPYALVTPPEFVAVGDVDNDGDIDVVPTAIGSSFSVLRNAGDGRTFVRTDHPTPDPGTRSVVVADVTNDGLNDLLLGGQAIDQPAALHLSIFPGSPDGGWGSLIQIPLADTINGLASGDVNRDGLVDYVVSRNNLLSVGIGLGAGQFAAPVDYSADGTPWTVRLADLNGDSWPDIVASSFSGGQSVIVLLNLGNGTFGTATRYVNGFGGIGLAAADFDLDGDVDIALANLFGAGIDLFFNFGQGTLFGPISNFVGVFVTALDAPDFDGDGDSDLVTVGDFPSPSPFGAVRVLWNRAPEFDSGDANCDGVISVGDIAGFVLALSNPAGYLTRFPNCELLNADINGDGNASESDIGPFVQLLAAN